MKKLFGILLAVAMMFSVVCALTACTGTTYEIAVVTDVGQLNDGGFNQGTYEGAKEYAEANGISYKYYQPANGGDATDADRIQAMNDAIANGAKVIVTPGYMQENALREVATQNPDVKFIFIDGWPLADAEGNILSNIAAISYNEHEAGYFAGYAAVKEGYRKLGGTFGGALGNPACNRFATGYILGAEAAAAELNVEVEIAISFKYGSKFSSSSELQAQMDGWYKNGTEVVFSCGGAMVNSVIAAAQANNGKVIGVDTDQAGLGSCVITSAVKGLASSVKVALEKLYQGKWSEIGGTGTSLGAKDDATGLPTAEGSWRMANFTVEQYNALFASMKAGEIQIVLPEYDTDGNWVEGLNSRLTKVTVTHEK